MASAICSTQIICTIGPACSGIQNIKDLIDSGMKIARLNFSHGDHAFHGNLIKEVREASQYIYPRCVGIALDTKGPEIRTGLTVGNQNITLVTDSVVTLTTDEQFKDKCTAEKIYIDYKSLPRSCKVGQIILLADGSVILQVKRITFENEVECNVTCGATFGSRKNCCIPGVAVDLPALAEKDISDIKFAAEQNLDIIFASFIRCADNVKEIRKILKSCPNGENIKIISKIENFQGVANIDEIIDVSDGIMVARGDLGMDLELSKVIAAQKMIIAKCNIRNKPVICATQMMESMIKNIRPTRAEVSDVGNAVLDGADCVMLSGETANGAFPSFAVTAMRKACTEAENIMFYKQYYEAIKNSKHEWNETVGVSMSAASISYKLKSDAIIVFSTSGRTAQAISNFRPKCPIVAVSRDKRVIGQLNLSRGVFPLHYNKPMDENWENDIKERLDFAIIEAKKLGLVRTDSNVIFVCGWQNGPGLSNTMRILRVGIDHTIRGMSKSISQQKLKI